MGHPPLLTGISFPQLVPPPIPAHITSSGNSLRAALKTPVGHSEVQVVRGNEAKIRGIGKQVMEQSPDGGAISVERIQTHRTMCTGRVPVSCLLNFAKLTDSEHCGNYK